MKEQVEERLRFYDEGIAPTKNITAMQVCTHNSGCPLTVDSCCLLSVQLAASCDQTIQEAAAHAQWQR